MLISAMYAAIGESPAARRRPSTPSASSIGSASHVAPSKAAALAASEARAPEGRDRGSAGQAGTQRRRPSPSVSREALRAWCAPHLARRRGCQQELSLLVIRRCGRRRALICPPCARDRSPLRECATFDSEKRACQRGATVVSGPSPPGSHASTQSGQTGSSAPRDASTSMMVSSCARAFMTMVMSSSSFSLAVS